MNPLLKEALVKEYLNTLRKEGQRNQQLAQLAQTRPKAVRWWTALKQRLQARATSRRTRGGESM